MPDSASFPHPLRLAVGSHSASSGAGCAMNVVSYENGDTQITDYPACADRVLARMVQIVNDTFCTHLDTAGEVQLLCPECSIQVLDLAHRTPGTALQSGVVTDRFYRLFAAAMLSSGSLGFAGAAGGEAAALHNVARLLRHGASHETTEEVLLFRADEIGKLYHETSVRAPAHFVYRAARIAVIHFRSPRQVAEGIVEEALNLRAHTALTSALRRLPSYAVMPRAEQKSIEAQARLQAAHEIITIFERVTATKADEPAPHVVADAVARMLAGSGSDSASAKLAGKTIENAG